jgi:putative glutamine amidotransferase
MPTTAKIGISACLMHPDPARSSFASKTLQYVEQSMAHWLISGGALPVMIPSPHGNAAVDGAAAIAAYAQWLDGLVLHGGADLSPTSYGETPLQDAWRGDRLRDDYERALVMAFVAAGKPVFGVCRGLQLINVAFGGTLYQDINTQKANTLVHRDAATYDANFHTLQVLPDTRLAQLIGSDTAYKINSIHHQGIKELAPGFVVEARCPDDGVVEAIRRQGPGYVAAVQWHPEFHHAALGTLDDAPLLNDFLQAALHSRTQQAA